MADDYDSPWKEALDFYFEAFLLLLFPEIHALIDWSRGYESLDKEFQQIVALEEHGNKQVSITSAGAAVSPEFLEFMCYDNNSNEVKFTLTEEPPPRPPQRRRH